MLQAVGFGEGVHNGVGAITPLKWVINSLRPEQNLGLTHCPLRLRRCGSNFKGVISEHMFWINYEFISASHEIAIR